MRQQLAQVFEAHGKCRICSTTRYVIKEGLFEELKPCPALLDALAGVGRPALDRKGLEKLLFSYDIRACDEGQARRNLVEELMAWAQGQPPTWCAHIQLEPPNSWKYQGDHSGIRTDVSCWDQCPVQGCHAPRPTP